MSSPIKSGSVHIEYQQGPESILNAHLRWLKHGVLGPYRTLMGIATLANKYLYPDLNIIPPAIQGYFESAAYHLGLNPTFPHLIELHLPSSPIRYEKVQIPCTKLEMEIPLLQFPVNTLHVQSDPVLNQEILKPHRMVGFSGGSDSYQAAFKLLQTIFKESTFTEDDFLLTSGPEFSKKAHAAIIKALNGKKIDEVIQNEGQLLVDRWNEYKAAFDLPTEMRRFAAAVITQVVFDRREGHETLEEAVSFMNDYLLKSVLGMATDDDSENFKASCKTFRTITNRILESDQTLPLFQEDFTLVQKQGLCLLLFFAGMETTAFALTHNFATLALAPSLQTKLRDSADKREVNEVNDFVDAQLYKILPVDGLSRKLTEDAIYSFEVSNQKVSKYLRKGEQILIELTADSIFGKGANQCIGKMLALKELRQSLHIILSNFTLLTTEAEFRSVAKITEQAESFSIQVKKRH